MKASRGQVVRNVCGTSPGDPPGELLTFVAEPRNRRERRARAAQERRITRAIERGETPAVYLPVSLKGGKP